MKMIKLCMVVFVSLSLSTSALSFEKQRSKYQFNIVKDKTGEYFIPRLITVGAGAGLTYTGQKLFEKGGISKVLGGAIALTGLKLTLYAINYEQPDKGVIKENPLYKSYHKLKRIVTFASKIEHAIMVADYIDFLKQYESKEKELNKITQEIHSAILKIQKIATQEVKAFGHINRNGDVNENIKKLQDRLNSDDLYENLSKIMNYPKGEFNMNFAYNAFMIEFYDAYQKTYSKVKKK